MLILAIPLGLLNMKIPLGLTGVGIIFQWVTWIRMDLWRFTSLAMNIIILLFMKVLVKTLMNTKQIFMSAQAHMNEGTKA